MPPRAETTRVETIKLPLPEPYTGARGKAEVFLEGMEAYFQFSAPTLPDKDKVALASYLLRDAARSWFKGAGDGALSTWNSFKEQLSKPRRFQYLDRQPFRLGSDLSDRFVPSSFSIYT